MSAAKRQRQSDIASIRPVGVSDSAISVILEALKARPEVLETVRTTKTTKRDLQQHYAGIFATCAYQVDLPLTSGGVFRWHFASPAKLLELFLQSCPEFKTMFLETTASAIANCEPLELVLYHDEFCPGRVLAPDNKRKTTAFYFTFKQFGAGIRSEFAWLPCACLRHTVSGMIQGGLGAAVRAVLRSYFC